MDVGVNTTSIITKYQNQGNMAIYGNVGVIEIVNYSVSFWSLLFFLKEQVFNGSKEHKK